MKTRYLVAFLMCVLGLTFSHSQEQIGNSKDTKFDSITKTSMFLTQEQSNQIQDATLNISAAKLEEENIRLKDLQQAYVFDSLWLNELAKHEDYFKAMYAEVTKDHTDSLTLLELPTDTLKVRLERLNEKTPFNIAYNPSLEQVIKSFLTKKRRLIQRMMTASQFYFPLFEEALDQQNIPLEIKYLAIVESALNPKARSRVGATGLWQFMFATGKLYDLEVSSYVDDRMDPIQSTKSAAKYLAKLYAIFNDWDLALAAYNSGPGNVNRAIRRSGGHTNYWNIRRNLPRETAGYVPAFLATMYLFEYASEHGLKGKRAECNYFETDTIHVKELITFDQISTLLNISKETLRVLNPQYKLDIIPKVKGKTYTLRLPIKHIGIFASNEDSIYAFAKNEIEKREKPLLESVESSDRIRYKVKSGDYLGKIAQRYRVGVRQIKRWNGLRGDNLRVGQRLTIYPRNPVKLTQKKPAVNRSNTQQTEIASNELAKVYEVQAGDSLWAISKKYPGISVENLRKWNGISGNVLKPGMKLKLCNCSS